MEGGTTFYYTSRGPRKRHRSRPLRHRSYTTSFLPKPGVPALEASSCTLHYKPLILNQPLVQTYRLDTLRTRMLLGSETTSRHPNSSRTTEDEEKASTARDTQTVAPRFGQRTLTSLERKRDVEEPQLERYPTVYGALLHERRSPSGGRLRLPQLPQPSSHSSLPPTLDPSDYVHNWLHNNWQFKAVPIEPCRR